MNFVIGFLIAMGGLIPAIYIGEWLDKKVSTEVGGLFKLVGALTICVIIVKLIGADNLNNFAGN